MRVRLEGQAGRGSDRMRVRQDEGQAGRGSGWTRVGQGEGQAEGGSGRMRVRQDEGQAGRGSDRMPDPHPALEVYWRRDTHSGWVGKKL